MLKKETVNMRLENANLCLAFGWEHFIFTNCFCGRAFFFDYVTRFLRDEGGLGRFGPDLVVVFVWLLKVVWAPRAQATFVRFMGWASSTQPTFSRFIGWDFGAHPINFHPLPSAEGRILPSTALRVENHMRTHRAR